MPPRLNRINPCPLSQALADVMCAKSAEGAAGQYVEEVVGGGQRARVATAAFFSKQYACANPLSETSSAVPPALQALVRLPVMDDPRTVMK